MIYVRERLNCPETLRRCPNYLQKSIIDSVHLAFALLNMSRRDVKVFKSAVRRALEHDAAALEITRTSVNLRFSAAMHENHLPVYKLIGTLTSDEERGSVQAHRREHKHSRAGVPATVSGAPVLGCAGLVSVDGDVPAHAALLENGWAPAGD